MCVKLRNAYEDYQVHSVILILVWPRTIQCYTLTFDSRLVVDFKTGYSTFESKETAETNHVNWEPEENA